MDLANITAKEATEVFKDAPHSHMAESEVLGQTFPNILVACGACKSKSEAKRIISAGGVFVNNHKASARVFFFL